jgi:hypothetical protein
MNNRGVWLFCGLICIYPILGGLVINWIVNFMRTHDWQNLRWSDVKFPWSKE